MEADSVLTPGEWEALIHGTPTDLKRLIYRLAVYHKAIQPPCPADCPLCGQQTGQQGQGVLSLELPAG